MNGATDKRRRRMLTEINQPPADSCQIILPVRRALTRKSLAAGTPCVISLQELAYIIVRARKYDGEVPPVDEESE